MEALSLKVGFYILHPELVFIIAILRSSDIKQNVKISNWGHGNNQV